VHAIAGRDHLPAQVTHRRLEGHIGAGAGFVEERGHHPPRAKLEQAAIVLLHALADGERGVEQDLQVVAVELVDGDDVLAGKVAFDPGWPVHVNEADGLAQVGAYEGCL